MPKRRRHGPVGLGKLELGGVEGGRRSGIGVRTGVQSRVKFHLRIGLGIGRRPRKEVEERSEVVAATLKENGVVFENVEVEVEGVGGSVTGDEGGGGGSGGGGDEGK